MHVVPVAWIRHVADEIGRNTPVMRDALQAGGAGAGDPSASARPGAGQALRRLHRGGGRDWRTTTSWG